jgi:hypothetical protein
VQHTGQKQRGLLSLRSQPPMATIITAPCIVIRALNIVLEIVFVCKLAGQ